MQVIATELQFFLFLFETILRLKLHIFPIASFSIFSFLMCNFMDFLLAWLSKELFVKRMWLIDE